MEIKLPLRKYWELLNNTQRDKENSYFYWVIDQLMSKICIFSLAWTLVCHFFPFSSFFLRAKFAICLNVTVSFSLAWEIISIDRQLKEKEWTRGKKCRELTVYNRIRACWLRSRVDRVVCYYCCLLSFCQRKWRGTKATSCPFLFKCPGIIMVNQLWICHDDWLQT